MRENQLLINQDDLMSWLDIGQERILIKWLKDREIPYDTNPKGKVITVYDCVKDHLTQEETDFPGFG